jgi:hypothetical protein
MKTFHGKSKFQIFKRKLVELMLAAFCIIALMQGSKKVLKGLSLPEICQAENEFL